MVSEVLTVLPSLSRIGACMLAMMLSAMRRASAPDASGASRTANSSPPRRATRSLSRNCPRMRMAMLTSTVSPAAWPRRSLISLKRSLSMNSTANCSRCSLASRSARLRRPSKKARLGRLVRLSWWAWCASEAFSSCRRACQDSSSSSRALKSSPSWLSSAMPASGTRFSKSRSRRTVCATFASWSSGPTIPRTSRRDR
ncbi:Uncharacterised protein [Pseudomonas aeruginosa]|nr:Uncharacterised protein [Pseudomonas aeruginosa]